MRAKELCETVVVSWADERAIARARSWLTQFRVLLNRAMLAQLRNPTDTTSRLFLSTWVGCLAGARPPPEQAPPTASCPLH